MARGATQNLAKMQAAVEELKKINLIAKPAKRMDVQMLAPMYQREDWDDADWTFWYEQGGESFEEAVAAEDPEVLLALGKGWHNRGWEAARGRARGEITPWERAADTAWPLTAE